MPIETQDLTHTYMPGSPFQATAIHNINIKINDGEFVGLIGHTGSGKSTLVQHFNALLTPSSGKVIIDGVDINEEKTNRRQVRQKVGLVFQYPEHQLFEETIIKDVGFGPKNLGLSKSEIDERVRLALSQVGIDYESYGEKSPFELSGGQMRRVAIAGVLAMQPSILILDEPTAGLDPAGRDAILNIIKALHEKGQTIIMVTHSMDDIAKLATRLIVMDHGEVAATGTPREIFSQINMMESIGLGVPQAVQLAHALREKGWPIPNDAYTLSEVQDYIIKYINKGEAGQC